MTDDNQEHDVLMTGNQEKSEILKIIKDAVEDNNLEHLERIFQTAAIVKSLDVKTEALYLATSLQNIECVKHLIRLGVDVNKLGLKGLSPLYNAAFHGNVTCANILLEAGALENQRLKDDGDTALFYACFRGHAECAKVLIEHGADVNVTANSNETPILNTSFQGSAECMNLLIRAGADVNVVGVGTDTPLIRTAFYGYTSCVDLLLKAGADVNIRDDISRTALRKAAQEDHPDCVELLLQAGADVNAVDDYGMSILDSAALEGNPASMKKLIAAGADVNRVDSVGNTPLITAAEKGRHVIAIKKGFPQPHIEGLRRIYRCIQLLIQAGSHLNKTNRNGLNAVQCCIQERPEMRKEIIMLLFAAGERLKDAKIPEFLIPIEQQLSLKHLARQAIRAHLIDINCNTHLFHRVSLLGLPSSLTNYLLYDVCLTAQKSLIK